MLTKFEIGGQLDNPSRLWNGLASFPFNVPSAGLSLTAKSALAGITIVALLTIWYVVQRYDIEPYVPLLALLALAAAMVATRRFAGVLVAGLLYVGNFKATPAAGLSLTDPTLIVLVLCAAGLFLECLLIFSGAERGSILRLFQGQGHAVLLFVVFILMIAVSELYTSAPESGLLKLERFVVFDTFTFFAPFILFKGRKDLDQFLITCVVLSLALTVRNLLDLFYPSARVLSGNQDITRIGDGQLIGTALVILIYHRFSGMRHSLRFVCISLLAIGLIASASRGAALSVLFVLIVMSLLTRSRPLSETWRRTVLGTVLAGIMAVAALLWMRHVPAAQMKFAHKADELSHLLKGSFVPGGTAEQRMNFYKKSVVAIKEKPILGWGVGGWGAFYLRVDQSAKPHNFILESAVEQGLVGCALLLGILITAGSALHRFVRPAGSFFAFLAPVFLLWILANLVSSGLENRILWFWCGTVFAISRMIQCQRKEPNFSLAAWRY